MKSALIQANAKINLDFEITGERQDGYHQIKSTFQSIDLSDFLSIKKANTNEFSGAKICPESQEIILKTKEKLEKTLNKNLPAKIHLQKSIPIAAGLGGGSSDAAAILLGLNLLYDLGLSDGKLAEIGAQIGADIPFFFYGGTCNVKGIGDKITNTKISLPKFFILFRPHKRIETKKMYQLYDKTGKDFLTLGKKICPEIKTLEKYFSKFGLLMKLSGSGPTVFCETDNYRLVKKITEGYQNFNGDIFVCHPQNKGLIVLSSLS